MKTSTFDRRASAHASSPQFSDTPPLDVERWKLSVERCARAFTLVELLVVITIIVILLALLTPAIDRAMYEAEMAVCAANMRGVGTAIGMYAADNKSFYPPRPIAEDRPTGLSGQFLLGAVQDARGGLMPYLALKSLIDPFCKPVDLGPESNDPDTFTYSSNALWFSWRFMPENNGQWLPGLRKLGDRLVWKEPNDTYTYKFDILISDSQALNMVTPFFSHTSHYDYEGAFVNQTLQRSPGISPGTYTYSWWISDLSQSYTMDCNYVHTDLSSQRLDGLRFDRSTVAHDSRLVPVPERQYFYNAPSFRNYLPAP